MPGEATPLPWRMQSARCWEEPQRHESSLAQRQHKARESHKEAAKCAVLLCEQWCIQSLARLFCTQSMHSRLGGEHRQLLGSGALRIGDNMCVASSRLSPHPQDQHFGSDLIFPPYHIGDVFQPAPRPSGGMQPFARMEMLSSNSCSRDVNVHCITTRLSGSLANRLAQRSRKTVGGRYPTCAPYVPSGQCPQPTFCHGFANRMIGCLNVVKQ